VLKSDPGALRHQPCDLVEVAPEDVSIGMRVEVAWEDVNDEITLPLFRPVKSGSGAS